MANLKAFLETTQNKIKIQMARNKAILKLPF